MRNRFISFPVITIIISLLFFGLLAGVLSGCSSPGDQTTVTPDPINPLDGMGIVMKNVPAKSFNFGIHDTSPQQVTVGFRLSETEITYTQWTAVKTWATGNGYVFSADNVGRRGAYNNGTIQEYAAGHDTDPATYLTWRDAVLWCNALTEYYNANNGSASDLACVYYTDDAYTVPLRAVNNSTTVTWNVPGSQDAPYIKPDANGFRLPGQNEWVLAAKFIVDSNNDGDIKDAVEYCIGSAVSGDATGTPEDSWAKGYPISTVFGNYCWYGGNSSASTHPVATRLPNALGLYDMSGNVCEYVIDPSGDLKVTVGASWAAQDLMALFLSSLGGITAYNISPNVGLRICQTQ